MGNQEKHRNTTAIVVFATLGVVLLLLAVMPMASPSDANEMTVPITTVIEKARAGEVSRIMVTQQGNDIVVQYRDGSQVRSVKEPGSLVDYLTRNGVDQNAMPAVQVQSAGGDFMSFLGPLFPILFFGGVMILMIYLFTRRRPSAAGGDQTGQAMQFARSKARVIVADRPTTNFEDVAGADEAKEELVEVVDFLKHPEKYAALGARIPKGLLMVGPPGTGKTLLARAVAGEAGVPFLSISGSEFVEMFVGVGAARVRDLFEQARKNAPCIVFIDEIDAVGRHRGAGIGGGNDEREQTLNQILVEMDGFDARTNIIIVAATNRPDVLDPALMRPGRFDRQIVLDHPDSKGRQAILRVHSRGKPMHPEVNLDALAKMTPGFSGADLENLLNEAALLAARRSGTTIENDDLHEAVDRVVAGPRRKSRIISPREKAITAYHEAGHALVAHALPHVDPVQKITIVSRGAMGGYTRVLPTEDRHIFTRSEFKDTLAWALGGQAAEEIVFGEMSTGASNDIERATHVARKMVTEYGMSERLGPVSLGRKDGAVFSNEIAFEIDQEVRTLMSAARETAHSVLEERRDILVALAEILIDQETIEGEELLAVLNGKKGAPAAGQASQEAADDAASKDRPADELRAGEHDGKRSATGKKKSSGNEPMAEAATSLLEDADKRSDAA
ncbi:MAG: ATP-dependent zinc metalloprotease FtsH [Chloroflexota bacterium]